MAYFREAKSVKCAFVRRAFAGVVLATGLAGCIDGEVGLVFNDADTIVARMDLLMERQLFDMAGESPDAACAQGRWTLSDTAFTCSGEQVMTMAEATNPALIETPRAMIDPSKAVQVVQLSPTQARVTVDFAQILSQRPQVLMPPVAGDLRAQVSEALQGHAFVFLVKGSRVVETTGQISGDGTSARFVFAAERLMDLETTTTAPFVTVIEFPSR